MASRYGKFNAADASWNDTTTWAATQTGATGQSVPVDGDDVYIMEGSFPIITGLDQSAVTLGSLTVLDGFKGGTIGTSATPLKVNVTNTFRLLNRTATLVHVEGTFGDIECQRLPQGELNLSAGSATNVRMGPDGYFEAGSDVEITHYSSAGARGLIGPDSTSPIDMSIDLAQSAFLECQRKIHTAVIAGELQTTGAAVGSATAGTSRWFVTSTGRLDIRSSGNINEVVALTGSNVTGENSSGFNPAPTITMVQHEGSSVRIPNHLYSVTYKPAGIVPGR